MNKYYIDPRAETTQIIRKDYSRPKIEIYQFYGIKEIQKRISNLRQLERTLQNFD